MKCYLCQSTAFKIRKGKVRDAPDLQILECVDCGLVSLSMIDHIQPGFYEESGMHGELPLPMDVWLKETSRDDQRRFDMLKSILPNKKLLEFGCGAGGFLTKAQSLADSVAGIELERRVLNHWEGVMTIYPDIESAGSAGKYDLIAAFHVIEHLPDPVSVLMLLSNMLTDKGRMVIEVPSSDDALLSLYDSDAFQNFSYWNQHLYLFNAETLRRLVGRAGLRIIAIQQHQRYSLSNHVYWLSQCKPSGHQQWSFLDSAELNSAYAHSLAAIGKCDTLIAHIERV
jgi:2-polyprenyl-3-methyl-5-hydroxy-6-metoxy-1,4-benzoquinol methylase